MLPFTIVTAKHNMPRLYADYMHFRKMGLRAVVALGVAKYGLSFMLDYLNTTDGNLTHSQYEGGV